jgi:hypothetical protein
MEQRPFDSLKKFYVASLAVLAVSIVLTPYAVKSGFSLLTEEILDTLIISLLFLIGFGLNRYYEQEVRWRERSLREAWKHVGEVNLLVERFKDVLVDPSRYPENRQEMKDFLGLTAEKIAGVVRCEAILLRLVDADDAKTLTELSFERNGQGEKGTSKVGNSDLLDGVGPAGCEVVASSVENTSVRAFCVLFDARLDETRRLFVQKIVNDLAMLYMIFSSQYYGAARGTDGGGLKRIR